MSADLVVLLIVVGYLVVLVGIGVFTSRLARDPESFFLAGRSLGAWVTAVSSTAASESGWVVLGAVGMAYKDGVSALWFAPGCLLGYCVNLYWLAPRLREAAAKHRSLTLLDLLVDRLGGASRLLRSAGALVILLSLAGYLAAQMTATGKAMEAILGESTLSYGQAVWVGGSIIVLYTLLGGFFAVAWTDFLQGLIMAASMLLMPLLALVAVGGYGRLLESLAALDPNLVTLSGGRSGGALFGFVVGLVGIGLGYPGQPHVLTRYMAAADGEKIRKTQLIAMLWGIVVFYGAGMLGLAGRVLMPDLADPEKLFPLLSRAMLHPVLAGVMLAAILSAIMSTVSSQLLVAASTLSRDLLEKVLGVCTTPRAALSAGRLTVLVLGILAMIVALQDVRVVFWFVLFAWSGLGAAFGPVLLLALSTRLVTVPGAVAGILTGFGVTVLWKQLGASETIIYEMVPAFLLSTLAVLGVSLLTRARPTRI